jgi:hypothetical protein
MKSFSSLVVVRQPAAVVFATVRDRLVELGPMVDDVASITELKREEVQPGRVRLINEWHAEQRVPELLARELRTPEVSWIDRNEWDETTLLCTWTVEPFVLTEHITCRGTTTYEPAMAGRGTRVTVEGTFDLAKGALGGLSSALERPVTAFVESIVTTLIPRNSRKVVEAAAALVALEGNG